MPEARLDVLINVAVRGAEKLKDLASSTREVGKASQEAGGPQGFGGMAKGLAAAAGGAVVAKKGYDFLKDAAGDAATLAKNTAALSRTTGMDAKSASGWVSIAKSRGIETNTLAQSMTIFSKNIRGAEGGSKQAAKAFADLGISAQQLQGMNTEQAIGAVADAFQQLPAGADKAAIAQQLFGRQSRTLLPLLNSGSEGIKEQQKAMQDAGLTMDESGVKKSLDLAKAQREMKAQFDGVKVAIGTALIPILLTLAQAFMPIVKAFGDALRSSPLLSGAVVALAGAFGGLMVANKVAGAVKNVSGAFNKLAANPYLVGLAAGVAAFLLLRRVMGPLPAAIIAVGVAFLVMGVMMSMNPIMLVIGAIALLIGGLVLLYQKCAWFRDAVNAVWNAIKTAFMAVVNFIMQNWRIMLLVLVAVVGGPIAAIIAAFFLFRSQFMSVISSIGNFFAGIWNRMKGVATGVFSAIRGAASGAFNTLKSAATSAVSWVGQKINDIVGFVAALPGKVAGFAAAAGKAIVDGIKNAITSAGDFIIEAVKSIVPGPLKKAIGAVFGQEGIGIPGRPSIPPGGSLAVVGEAGPELLRLPYGSQVIPLQAGTMGAPDLSAFGQRPIHVHVEVDGREIAFAVAQQAATQQARR